MAKKLAFVSVLVVLVFAAASGANAITHDKRTYFTFNQPVALPGVTLPAGTYMFRIANPETSRNVIQVANREGTQSYAMLNTVQASRPDAPKDSEIRFLETAAGAPAAVGTYWYMGERTGYEFMYSKDQLAALNRGAQPAPTETKAAESTNLAESESSAVVPPLSDPDTSRDVVDGAGFPSVDAAADQNAQQPNQAVAPAPEPAPSASSQADTTRSQLPHTASPLALLLLGGVASAGMGVKLLRKS
jgi:hypothetical protein